MKRPFLFVALDGTEGHIIKMASTLSRVEGDFGFKVNLDYLLHLNKGLETTIGNIQAYDKPVFTDLKMWNGRRTMLEVIKTLVGLGVDYLNVYALADDLLPEAIEATKDSKTKVLGLTVLSHYDNDYCLRHFGRTFVGAVVHFAKVALNDSCHCIILPGTTLHIVKGLDGIKVATGIRPDWYEDKRHRQVVTPKQAVEEEADALVCGSPITKSSNPIEALKKVLSEMQI